MPGSVSVNPKAAKAPACSSTFTISASVGDHAAAAIVDHHEEHDGDAADGERHTPLPDRVPAERRADGALLEQLERRRQRAVAQHVREVLRLVELNRPVI